MASTIKVNTIQNTCGADIIKESGNTITIGASGDTVTLASGASQSGFGRSGSVNWQTAIKTANFTATSGEGYFCNTSGGAFTLTLPSSPSVGDIVALKDYGSSFNTENLTIDRNGSNLNGSASNFTAETVNLSLTLVYADSTKGWLSVEEGTGFIGEGFISATGGTITTSGDCKIHTFTGPGDFVVGAIGSAPANNVVSYLVVAGGGGGGRQEGAGGGGAGGFREFKSPVTPYTASPLDGNPGGTQITVSAQTYPITVGGGGATGPSCSVGSSGSQSVFSTITSTGGGGGGAHNITGANGGSGGGAGGRCNTSGGSGNTPPVTPSQGNNGGNSKNSPSNPDGGGGGGGATAVGGQGFGPTNPDGGAPGGAGATTSINATPTTYAGGGGGGKDSDSPNGGDAGDGGAGGGGQGGSADGSPRCATAGTANTGGGGGGGGKSCKPGKAGGSGIVIIRYKFQ
jgi:hypothetical protein